MKRIIKCAVKSCNRVIQHNEKYLLIVLKGIKQGTSKKVYICDTCMERKVEQLDQVFEGMYFGNLRNVEQL